MHVLIDGYNLIKSTDWLSEGSLDVQRDRLIQFLERRRPQGRNDVTVVFDGRPGRNPPLATATVRVLFAGIDADSAIKTKVDRMANPSEALVVTNDRAIQRWVRGAGARIVSCADFLASAEPDRKRTGTGGDEPPDAGDITDELRRLWT